MVQLKKEEVIHVAKLSNLKLNSNQLNMFKQQLEGIIGYIENLHEVDTSNVEPTSQTTGLTNVLREDNSDITKTLTAEDALSQAKNTNNNLFVVPIILSERSDK